MRCDRNDSFHSAGIYAVLRYSASRSISFCVGSFVGWWGFSASFLLYLLFLCDVHVTGTERRRLGERKILSEKLTRHGTELTFHAIWIFNQPRLNTNISHSNQRIGLLWNFGQTGLCSLRSVADVCVKLIYLYLRRKIVKFEQHEKSSPWLVNQRGSAHRIFNKTQSVVLFD